MSDPIMIVTASHPRRIIGMGVQVFLGLLLLYIAFAAPPANFGWQLFLIVIAVVALANARKAWRASERKLVLTEGGLFDDLGNDIAPLAEIAKVDRALFSFKPSNGFLIRMNTKQPRTWEPGMWWRFGKRVGIGGVLRGAETKMIADALSMMVATRDGDTGL